MPFADVMRTLVYEPRHAVTTAWNPHHSAQSGDGYGTYDDTSNVDCIAARRPGDGAVTPVCWRLPPISRAFSGSCCIRDSCRPRTFVS